LVGLYVSNFLVVPARMIAPPTPSTKQSNTSYHDQEKIKNGRINICLCQILQLFFFGRYTRRVYIKLYKGYGWLWLDHVDPNHWTMVTPRSLEGSSLVRSPSARDPYPLDQGGAENCNITFFEGRGVKNVILQ